MRLMLSFVTLTFGMGVLLSSHGFGQEGSAVQPKIYRLEFQCAKAVGQFLQYPQGAERTPEGKPRFDSELGLIVLPVDPFSYRFVTDNDIYYGNFDAGAWKDETKTTRQRRFFRFEIPDFGKFTATAYHHSERTGKLIGEGAQIFKEDLPPPSVNFCDESNSAEDLDASGLTPISIPCEQMKLKSQKNAETEQKLYLFLAEYIQELSALLRETKNNLQARPDEGREKVSSESVAKEVLKACEGVKNLNVEGSLRGLRDLISGAPPGHKNAVGVY